MGEGGWNCLVLVAHAHCTGCSRASLCAAFGNNKMFLIKHFIILLLLFLKKNKVAESFGASQVVKQSLVKKLECKVQIVSQ